MQEEIIQQIRDFNRFYTNVIGLLDKHILASPYSLPEARVLYELSHNQPCTASQIMESFKMDKGYLSRILRSFEKKGLLAKKQSKEDERTFQLTLTAEGNKEFSKINAASIAHINSMLSHLSASEVKEVMHHMNGLKLILSKVEI